MACMVYGRFDSKIRLRIGRPIRFEIRFEGKKRFAGPYAIQEKYGF